MQLLVVLLAGVILTKSEVWTKVLQDGMCSHPTPLPMNRPVSIPSFSYLDKVTYKLLMVYGESIFSDVAIRVRLRFNLTTLMVLL